MQGAKTVSDRQRYLAEPNPCDRSMATENGLRRDGGFEAGGALVVRTDGRENGRAPSRESMRGSGDEGSCEDHANDCVGLYSEV